MFKHIKKIIPFAVIALALFFTSPVNNASAAAHEDGEYNITAEALHADKDEASVAADYINEDATLEVADGQYTLSITVPKAKEGEPEFTLYGMQIDGADDSKDEDDDNIYYTFQMDDIDEILNAHTQYEVPDFDLDHDVDFRFQLNGLDDIPEVSSDSDENSNTDNDDNATNDESGENSDSGNENAENNDSNDDGASSNNDGDTKDQTAAASKDNNDNGSGDDKGTSADKKEDNPKTGDETPIVLFGLLLIGSGAFLVRRLVVTK